MRRMLTALTLTMLGFAATASAQDHVDRHGDGVASHNTIGLGFHTAEAPVGLRWWFPGQKMALDLGFGVTSDEVDDSAFGEEVNESTLGWTIDAGLPLVMRSWERVHVMLRPGILYSSQEFPFDVDAGPGVEIEMESATSFAGRLEIEAEVFLANNFSVSASHGIEFASSKPAVPPGAPDAESSTNFRTIGGNFTSVGFHVYLWGGGN